MWLRATIDGLSVVPISQVIEVADTRSPSSSRCSVGWRGRWS